MAPLAALRSRGAKRTLSRKRQQGGNPMRIAIVAEVFLPKIDGVVGRTLNLIRHLVAAGDEVLIVCPQAEGCTQCEVPVLPVPSFTFPPYPEYRVGIPDRSLAAKLKEFKPDVIHYLN